MDKNDLKVFCEKYSILDPMIVFTGKEWFLYVLLIKEKVNQDNFFMAYNPIYGFRSTNLENWESVGEVIAPNSNEIISSGSAVFYDGRIYLFYAKSIEKYSEYHLDQRLFLAESEDGIHFKNNRMISPLPDKDLYNTNCIHPENGKMLFAWRDPFSYFDLASKKYYLFICTGGFRWQVPPNIAVAVSDELAGPYDLLSPAIEYESNVEENECLPIGEIERHQVFFHNNKYYLLASCWLRDVKPKLKEMCAEKGIPLSDSTIYKFCAETITGPYKFCWDSPVISGSDKTGFYGGQFFDLIKDKNPFLIGWHAGNEFNVSVNFDYQMMFDREDLRLVAT